MNHVSPFARLKAVPVQQVKLHDAFWAPRRQNLVQAILPHQYNMIASTGRLQNFLVAAGCPGMIQGYYFNDSDVYKWLEAAVQMLAEQPNSDLKSCVETVITAIAQAQQPNGYLDTYFSGEKASQRWKNVRDLHELYCAGHFFQAATAHQRAFGSDELLVIARKLADHLVKQFGPGGQPATPGHPEVEMALVDLYRLTQDKRYLQLAQSFLDQRGKGLIGGRVYHVDHQPFREMEQLAGHAVRALYLCSGAADLYLETGEAALLSTMQRLWQRMTSTQLYLTGGLGARHDGEAFGEPYELPNARAYAETCAGIASLYWNVRMQQIEPHAKYADLFEWTLYNAVLPGLSLDGLSYFYENPLFSNGSHRRQGWFECACCPPNLSRLLAALPGYFYSTSLESMNTDAAPDGIETARLAVYPGLWVHQYASSTVELPLPDGRTVHLVQSGNYPWEGQLSFEIQAIEGPGSSKPALFSLFLRIPDWCEAPSTAAPTLTVNGEMSAQALQPGSYVELNRRWQPGDQVVLTLPMAVRMLESHPAVLENAGRIALSRGPLLYCLEAVDQPGCTLPNLAVRVDSPILPQYETDMLGGVTVLKVLGEEEQPGPGWEGRLYRPLPQTSEAQRVSDVPPAETIELTAIPYFAWANRAAGGMQVWLRYRLNPGQTIPL